MFIKWHHFAIWMTFKYYYCCNIELTYVRFGQIFKFKCPMFTPDFNMVLLGSPDGSADSLTNVDV